MDVQKAIASYIAVVETNLFVRRAGGDVDAANEKVVADNPFSWCRD